MMYYLLVGLQNTFTNRSVTCPLYLYQHTSNNGCQETSNGTAY